MKPPRRDEQCENEAKEHPMMHTLRTRLGLALAAVAALAGLSLADNPEERLPFPPSRWPVFNRAWLIAHQVNYERQKAGLPPLQFDKRLDHAAAGHARNMAQQHILSHVLNGQGPGDRITAAGYNYSRCGECIGGSASAQDTVAKWMANPFDRAIILNPIFTQCGAGSFQETPQSRPYDCMDFARPL
jgi:hypothetical protein